jgi:hypothetical protein
MTRNQLVVLVPLAFLAGCATRGSVVNCDGPLQPINAWPIDDPRPRGDVPDDSAVQPGGQVPP